MAYLVWTCNGNPRSYNSAAYWQTFESNEDAKEFASMHPDCMDGSIPVVEKAPSWLPAGKSGSVEDFPIEADFDTDFFLNTLFSFWVDCPDEQKTLSQLFCCWRYLYYNEHPLPMASDFANFGEILQVANDGGDWKRIAKYRLAGFNPAGPVKRLDMADVYWGHTRFRPITQFASARD